jgi:hypothetical protein
MTSYFGIARRISIQARPGLLASNPRDWQKRQYTWQSMLSTLSDAHAITASMLILLYGPVVAQLFREREIRAGRLGNQCQRG